MKHWIPCASRGVKGMWGPLSRWGRHVRLSLGSPQGSSDLPSSCEMKDETEFKTLQGNWAFFWVRASRGPFHLRQKTQGPSHIPTADGKLLLRCLWKVGSPLQSKTGNQISSYDDMGFMELSSSCYTEINIHIVLRLVSQLIAVVS